jgi:hypothetical protein
MILCVERNLATAGSKRKIYISERAGGQYFFHLKNGGSAIVNKRYAG